MRASPLPVSQENLCSFCAYLADDKLKHRTIKVYLSAVRYMQIAAAYPDPFSEPLPRLHYVLRGIKKAEAAQQTEPRERLPITPPLLLCMKRVWQDSSKVDHRDKQMLWAACCVCFFAFLRVGEMTVPSDNTYDPSVHLGIGDIAVDDPQMPSMVRIRIKQSKTDPFRKGIYLFVGRTASGLCPVAAVLGYLQSRGMEPGPLFRFHDGRVLTRPRFAAAVRSALKEGGVDQSKFCTHSFRIGAATMAAAKGVEDSIIKTLGRWESVAYLQYVRIPREQLTAYSRRLVQ